MNARLFLTVKTVQLVMFGQLFLHAQVQEASPVGSVQLSNPSLQAFLSEQQSLMQERQALLATGANMAQLKEWGEQNAAQFSAQRQLAGSLSSAATLQLSSTSIQPNIPADASSALANFLTLQAALAQGRAQTHNNSVQLLSAGSNAAQVKEALSGGSSSFQQLNSGNLALAVQESQGLAAQAAQTPLPLPQAPQFPANASPQLIAFQTQFYQLNLQRIKLWNAYTGASSEARKAAFQAWRAQNATAIEQLREQAQTLKQATSAASN